MEQCLFVDQAAACTVDETSSRFEQTQFVGADEAACAGGERGMQCHKIGLLEHVSSSGSLASVMRRTISIHPLLPFRAVNPISTIEAPTICNEGESNQQDEEDEEHCHDGFPFCTHRAWLGATLYGDPCRVVLGSFTRVNAFLLLVYLVAG